MMNAKPKATCQYDGKCIRKNPSHFEEYDHPLQYPDGHPSVIRKAQRTNPTIGVPAPPLPLFAASGQPMNTPTLQLSTLNPFSSFIDTPPQPVQKPQSSTHTNTQTFAAPAPEVTGSKRERSDPEISEGGRPQSEMGGNKHLRSEATDGAQPRNPSTSGGCPPGLYKTICERAPKFSDFATTIQNQTQIRCLSDLYHVEFPEAEMRAMLAPVIGLADPLGAYPGVRLVGPFEVLLRIMVAEQLKGLLSRDDFPSDEALWGHWRYRHDPLEAVTFLVSCETYWLHTGKQNPSAALVARNDAGVSILQQRCSELNVFELGHCYNGAEQSNHASFIQTYARDNFTLPCLDEANRSDRHVSLAFYRDEWQPVSPNRQQGMIPSQNEVPGSATPTVKQPRGPTRLTIIQSLAILHGTKCFSSAVKNPMYNCPMDMSESFTYRPLGSSVGRAVSYAVELTKGPLMAILKSIGKAKGSIPTPLNLAIQPHQLEAGKALQQLFPPYSEKEITSEITNRKKFSKGKTFNGLNILVPYDPKTEMGYRDPYLSLSDLEKTVNLLNAMSASAVFSHHADTDGKGRALPKKMREEFEEELRWLDIGNDECDFGYGLEVGTNLLYESGGCRCKKCLMAFTSEGHHSHSDSSTAAPHITSKLLETSVCNEVLAHAVRVLDTAFTLLNRPVSQFMLRCHARLLIAGRGRFEVAVCKNM